MTSHKKKYALLLLADENYLEKTKAVFYAAVRYGNWQYELILLAYEILTPEKLEWFKVHQIKIIHIDRFTFPFENIKPEHRVYYAKIYLFNPYFKKYHKIIYLDTDTIIRKDIRGLVKYRGFRAADDHLSPPLIYQFNNSGEPYENSKMNRYFSRKTLFKRSFNTGVMVIPSKHNSLENYNKLITLANTYACYSSFYEQGILNLFLLNKRKKLPYVFNNYYITVTNKLPKYINRTKKHSVILHFIGPHKPWDMESICYDEWQKLYTMAKSLEKWSFPLNKAKTGFFDIIKTDIDIAYHIYQKKHKPNIKNTWHRISWHIEMFLKRFMPAIYRVLKKKFGKE